MRKQLLIDQPPIFVLPDLAKAIGFNKAAVLQATHFLLNPLLNPHFKDGCYWVDNLESRLREGFLFWDEDAIRNMVVQLEQSGILTVRQEVSSKGVSITYHTINYGLLEQFNSAPANLTVLLGQNEPMEQANSNRQSIFFKAELYENGHNRYVMALEDKRHFLECGLSLEIQDVTQQEKPPHEPGEGPTNLKEAICYFPRIDVEKFQKLIRKDETLYEVLMDLFLMNAMKQLLSFCLVHDAARLVIFLADSDQETNWDIYHEFLMHRDQTSASKDQGKGLVYPADRKAFDSWKELMEQSNIEFQQTLWRERKGNPAIKNYLMQHGWPKV